jgi:hypothetical protein
VRPAQALVALAAEQWIDALPAVEHDINRLAL